jgi:uncharacterized protein YbjQ (UPF0145 family)
MKKIIGIAAILASCMAAGSVVAAERHNSFSLESALNSSAAKEKLDSNVELYFGKQKHPKVVESQGVIRTSKKTNGFGKSDQKACEWALISALISLQAQAEQQGGNAVIEIKSNYQNKETSSETEYVCVSGALMSGVALKGKVVKLAK